MLTCLLLGALAGLVLNSFLKEALPNQAKVSTANLDAEDVAELTYDLVKERYKSVNDTLQKHHEFPIQIKHLFLYPVRGIPGIQVREVELGNHGIRHDRIFVIVGEEDKKPLTCGNFPKVTTLS